MYFLPHIRNRRQELPPLVPGEGLFCEKHNDNYDTTEACRWHEWNIILYNLSGGRQKSYLATTRRVIWLSPEELSGGRQKRRVIWLSPEELSGGRQKSYEGKSKITKSFLIWDQLFLVWVVLFEYI